MRVAPIFFLLCFVPTIGAQQVADSVFTFPNPNPAFENGLGPKVCVDEAHNNFHTLEGRYFAFGKLLRGDGFRTAPLAGPFDGTLLEGCEVLVIANALAPENAEDWQFPNPSAFSGPEIVFLTHWVKEGGNLLLVMDHWPFPGAVSDLASLLGAVPLNGRGVTTVAFGELGEEAMDEEADRYGYTPEDFREAMGTFGTLGDHPILKGRDELDEPIRGIMTFGGSAFLPSATVQPLLRIPDGGVGFVPDPDLPPGEWPRYSLNGWLVGGASRLGEGRVVVLAEAAMCSAQLSGPERNPMGMNSPLSVDNPRFCLNVVRWLARVF